MKRDKQVASFYRQLAVLLEAGYSLIRALGLLSQRASDRRFATVIRALIDQVEKGSTFWEALEKQPSHFPAVHTQMIRVGENGGRLGVVLDRLADTSMQEIAIRNRMVSTMAYPVVILIVVAALIGFLTTAIVPTFAALLEETRTGLPLPTKLLIGLSMTVQRHWIVILLSIGLFVLLLRFAAAVRRVRYVRDWLKLRVAAFGPLTKEHVVVHTCQTLAMLLQAGINIVRALELTRDASPNLVVSEGLDEAREEVTAGRGLEASLRRSGILPPLVVDMIATGHESGTLDKNLQRAAEIYEEELGNKMRLLSGMTEPALVLLIGGVVMFVVLSFFLPYIKLVGVMSGS